MTHTYIKFDTQTLGEKARRLLREAGIRSVLRRNPNPNHKEGCNFALFVYGDIWQAYGILIDKGIRSSGVESYREGI